MKTVILAALVLAGLAFIILHLVWYIRPSEVKTVSEFDARLSERKPLIVEYYSNL